MHMGYFCTCSFFYFYQQYLFLYIGWFKLYSLCSVLSVVCIKAREIYNSLKICYQSSVCKAEMLLIHVFITFVSADVVVFNILNL